MGFPYLWTIIHFTAVAGNQQWSWAGRNPPRVGRGFGSVPTPQWKRNNAAAAGDETLSGGTTALSTLRQSAEHLLPSRFFSLLLARAIARMKGSQIYWLWPCTLSYFDHPMAERNCTSEVPVTSWERNCARFSCHDSVSPGRQYYYFSAECSLSVVLSFKKENRGDFIFGVAGVTY